MLRAASAGSRRAGSTQNDQVDQSPSDIAAMAQGFATNNPQLGFDADAFAEVIETGSQPPNRGDAAVAICAALAGCTATDRDGAILWLLAEGISVGQLQPGDPGYDPNDPINNFGATNPVIVGQVGTLFNRVQDTQGSDDGYQPPGGHNPSGPTDPGCPTGFTIIQAHVSGTDDGCRPSHCDFGRDANGWCLPPTNTDTPVVYVVGTTVDEGGGNASFRVALSHAVTASVSVFVATADDTATSGSDYTAVRRTVTFSANTTSQWVDVPVLNDNAFEGDEAFTMQLSNPSAHAALSANPTAAGTIQDDDSPPADEPTNVVFTCTSSGGVFTLNASWDPPLATANGYQVQLSSNRVAWNPSGQLYFGLTTTTTLTATAPSAGTYYAVIWPYGIPNVGNGQQVSVSTECAAAPVVSLTGAVNAREGTALGFEVQLDQVAAVDVTVTVSTDDDPSASHLASSAGTQRDYIPKSGHDVVIPAGSLSAPVSVFTVADSDDEHDETLMLRVDAVTSTAGGTIGSPDQAVGTIIDNDNAPVVSIADVSASESGAMIFNLALSAGSRKPVTVTVATAASSPVSAVGVPACTATDGSEDYRSGSATVTFAANSDSAMVTVAICDDTAAEGDETFTVTLHSPTNATVSPTAGSAVGTIVDNDTPVCGQGWLYDPGHPDANAAGCRPGFLR